MTTATTFQNPQFSDFPFLPLEFQLPTDNNQWRDHIAERHRRIADMVNIRENGQYELSTEDNPFRTLTAQQWFSKNAVGNVDNNTKRYSYRSVVDFGTLPNNTSKSVAHGIPVAAMTAGPPALDGTLFTKIYGTATHPTNTDPMTKAIPIPFVNSATPGDDVELRVTDTNVIILATEETM